MNDLIKLRRAKFVAELIRSGTNTPARIFNAVAQNPDWAYRNAAQKALQSDLARLKVVGLHFRFDRTQKCYIEVQGEGIPLPFTDDELILLAQLCDVYRLTPYDEIAQGLYAKLCNQSDSRQRKILKKRPLIQIRLPVLDELKEHMATAGLIEEAFQSNRELMCRYRMPSKIKHVEMRFQVLNPLQLQDGHVYFEVWLRETNAERQLRLDRVIPGSARLLPTKRPARNRADKPLTIRYWLAAGIEPSKHFPKNFRVESTKAGSIITADIEERKLFWATRQLLKYGSNCKVLQPPEMVEEMRRHSREMSRHYESPQ